MTRFLRALSVCVLCSVAACGDDPSVTITLFQASPDVIEAGQSTKLLFAVDPTDAKVTIAGVGDVTGKVDTSVSPAKTTTYRLTATNGSAVASGNVTVMVREPTVTITLFQASPDIIEAGQSTKLLFAADPTNAKLEIAGVGDVTGKVDASVSPATTTTYHLTATNGSAVASGNVTVMVGPVSAAGIKVEPASATPTAGESLSVTLTAIVANGTTAAGFRGTVHLTSTDPEAVLPGDVVFDATDAGVKQVKVTLKAAGVSTLNAVDAASPARSGAVSMTVKPAAASTCTAGQAPAVTAAGSVVGVSVVLHDEFNNVATGYTGTVRLTATDVRAVLPPDVTYGAADAGSHAFSAQLLTTGDQVLTATDTANAAIHCEATLTVAPGVPKLVLAIPGDANAGYPVGIDVTVTDVFDNPMPRYAGTVTFTSSDTGPGAAVPAPIVFTPGSGGVRHTSATFVTLGAQTIGASDGGDAPAIGSAVSTVHGLVYSAPTTGRVRLVANAAQSNTQVVQLDLVANERLEIPTFFGGGPGSFAAGMNLPLDTTRVGADATLFSIGNTLVVTVQVGTPPAPVQIPPIGTARIGDDHVLYTAVSRKRLPGTIFTQGTEVRAGEVFYSVRVKLTSGGTVGTVFDGAQPSPLYRASVRDQYGDDFVNQSDFGIGKLEIR